MDAPERQPPAPNPLRDTERRGNKALSLLLLGGITLTMTAWIVFLGWAAWALLGGG